SRRIAATSARSGTGSGDRSARSRPRSSSAISPSCAPPGSPAPRSHAGSPRSGRSSGTSSSSAPATTTRPPSPTSPGGPRSAPAPLPPADAEPLVEAANGPPPRDLRDRALVELLYGAGLRVSEAVGLGKASVDLDGRLVRAFGKGSKERVVPLGRHAAES